VWLHGLKAKEFIMKDTILSFSLYTVAFVGIGFSFSPGNAQTPEKIYEYWSDTSLAPGNLIRWGLLEEQKCKKSAEHLDGCIAAVNTVANLSETKLRFVPKAALGDPDYQVGEVVKDFGLFVLAKSKGFEKPLKAIEHSKFLKRQYQKRIKIAEELLETKEIFNFGKYFKEMFDIVNIKENQISFVTGAAWSSMLQSTDAHARVVPTEQHMDEQKNPDGPVLYGIGVQLKSDENQLSLYAIMDGGPADNANLKANDVVLSVDGKSMKSVSSNEAPKYILGKENTNVELEINRNGNIFKVVLTRKKITQANVQFKLIEDLGTKIGLIKLRQFVDPFLCKKIAANIAELTELGAKGLILDLRSNPGGLLDQANCLSSLFVGKQITVKVKAEDQKEFINLIGEMDAMTDLPTVVLIDAGSASASELVSGALQDHKRAWIMGDVSFGKGTVQNGSEISFYTSLVEFKTVQRFYQPSGRTNQMVGITPDFIVPFKPNATEEELFRLREADYYPNGMAATGELWSQSRVDEVERVNKCRSEQNLANSAYEKKMELKEKADFQLLSAQEVLKCEIK
jgi:carboxyl-terminal processing protease